MRVAANEDLDQIITAWAAGQTYTNNKYASNGIGFKNLPYTMTNSEKLMEDGSIDWLEVTTIHIILMGITMIETTR